MAMPGISRWWHVEAPLKKGERPNVSLCLAYHLTSEAPGAIAFDRLAVGIGGQLAAIGDADRLPSAGEMFIDRIVKTADRLFEPAEQ